jgi:hypothetical protein
MRKFYLFFLHLKCCLLSYLTPSFVLKYGAKNFFMFLLGISQKMFAVYIPICFPFLNFIKYFLDYPEYAQDLKVLKFVFFGKD